MCKSTVNYGELVGRTLTRIWSNANLFPAEEVPHNQRLPLQRRGETRRLLARLYDPRYNPEGNGRQQVVGRTIGEGLARRV